MYRTNEGEKAMIKIVSKPNCTECERIKFLMQENGIEYAEEDMTTMPSGEQFELRNIARKNRQVSMPMMFVDGEFMTTKNFEKEYLG